MPSGDGAGTSTPKGRRRREALVAAAADLVVTGGPAAVSARAVARAAGVPLAAITYYFANRDELLRAGVDLVGHDHLTAALPLLDTLHPGIGRADVAAVLVRVVAAPGAPIDQDVPADAVAAYYAGLVAGAREPAVRASLAGWDRRIQGMVGRCLAAAGRDDAAAAVVVAQIDGSLLATVLADDGAPLATAARQVSRVLDLLAPATGVSAT